MCMSRFLYQAIRSIVSRLLIFGIGCSKPTVMSPARMELEPVNLAGITGLIDTSLAVARDTTVTANVVGEVVNMVAVEVGRAVQWKFIWVEETEAATVAISVEDAAVNHGDGLRVSGSILCWQKAFKLLLSKLTL